MRHPTILSVSLTVLLLTGEACREPAGPAQDPLTPPDAVVVDGTVAFRNVEGGCWAITDGGQTQYEARGLPDAFKRDGLEVRAAIKEPPQWGSYCMIGPVVDVLWIRRR